MEKGQYLKLSIISSIRSSKTNHDYKKKPISRLFIQMVKFHWIFIAYWICPPSQNITCQSYQGGKCHNYICVLKSSINEISLGFLPILSESLPNTTDPKEQIQYIEIPFIEYTQSITYTKGSHNPSNKIFPHLLGNSWSKIGLTMNERFNNDKLTFVFFNLKPLYTRTGTINNILGSLNRRRVWVILTDLDSTSVPITGAFLSFVFLVEISLKCTLKQWKKVRLRHQ